MSLEPTDEQRAAIRAVVDTADEWFDVEGKLFAIIRDMVLEAAKKACEAQMDEFNASAAAPGNEYRRAFEECGANGAANCAARIHSMMGGTP